jgi:predicted O-methyltransferase YrrM
MKPLIMIAMLLVSSLFSFELHPFPWITEGATAYLEDYLANNSQAKVLEFGSGGSTVWFAQRSGSITSVEHSPLWCQMVRDYLAKEQLTNVTLVLKPLPYYSICQELPREYFDLVFVDGRNRKACILYSIPLLKRGGVLMLDDAQRPYYALGIDVLKDWQGFSSHQLSADVYGFPHNKRVTRWWIKP